MSIAAVHKFNLARPHQETLKQDKVFATPNLPYFGELLQTMLGK